MSWIDTLLGAGSSYLSGVANTISSVGTPGPSPKMNTSTDNVWQNLGQGTNDPTGVFYTAPQTELVNILQGNTSSSGNTSPSGSTGSIGTEAPTTPTQTTDWAAAAAAQAEAERAAARQKEIDQANRDLRLQESYLGSAKTGFDTTKASIQDLLNRVLSSYKDQTGRVQSQFNEQSNVNTGNYNRDLQSAMNNAARGRQGLFGQLAAMGALSGSGITLADQAVQTGANQDIGGATTEFRNNAGMLKGALEEYETEDAARRAATEAKARAMTTQAENNYNKDVRDTYVKMATLYNTLGDAANADKYTRMAQDLGPRIGQTQAAPISDLSPIAASFTPEALGSYMNQGVKDISIGPGGVMPNGLLPSLIATIRRRDERGA